MLFILSKNISVRRKIFFYGLMFVTISIVVASMTDLDLVVQAKLYQWAAALFVLGASLISLAGLNESVKKSKNRWGYVAYFIYAILIVAYFFTAIRFT